MRLTEDDADDLRADPAVALVEPDAVRKVAATSATAATSVAAGSVRAGAVTSPGALAPAADGGGAGTVIGVVDTGLAPESRLFVRRPGAGQAAR